MESEVPTYNGRFAKIMQTQYKNAKSRSPHNIAMTMCPTDIAVWYVKLHNVAGLQNEYHGGEYIMRLHFPSDYPLRKPTFEFLTPNGVYKIGHKICMDAHNTTDIIQLCNIVMSNMIQWADLSPIDGIVTTTANEKMCIAHKSVESNVQYGTYFAQ